MGEDRLHPEGFGCEAGVTQQRIEPDQPAARLVQTFHLARQSDAGVAIESVGNEQHDRALAKYAARPAVVELSQALADTRAARPVFDSRRDLVERLVDVARAQR